MSQRNETLTLIITFLITSAILGGGYWWFTRDGKLNLSNISLNNSVNNSPNSNSNNTSNQSIPKFPFPETVPSGTTINIDGSTSLVQVNQALKSAFQQAFPGTIVITNAKGSDNGINNLIADNIDIAAISRPLTPTEKKQGLVAIPISKDAIAIVIGINNTFRRGLTQNQIMNIFQGNITNWSQIGGEKATITVINRPKISGTHKIFQELALNGGNFGNLPNFQNMDRDATTPILQALGKNGISYATYAQVVNQTTVRTIPVDGLTPEAANYPYQRTLYYVYKEPANPAVKAFLGYITSPQGKQIIENAKSNSENIQVATSETSQKKTPIPKNQDIVKSNNQQKSTTPKPIAYEPAKTNNNLEKKPALTPLKTKEIRGIYLSRYQATNRASENTIRERVRYYKSQGINTIIQGVWGNGCTMYNSEVMQKTFGYKSCPNEFQDQWLDWLIDEAHKQGMEVHAYFEKGIKIDENSPIFDLAISKKWIVPGVDRTYSGIEHYVLDVEIPEVGKLFTNILTEFVQKYPKINAVQFDDYLGYHADLPGKVDRTENLTKFVQQMITSMKKANPNVSFDICHHNPYWAKRYFAADWENWKVDRVFIQAYNEANFTEELNYAEKYDGIAILDKQLPRLKEIIKNPKITNILVFPLAGKPEKTASDLKNLK